MSHTIGPWRVMQATSQERDAMRIIYSADLQRVAVIPDVEFAARREAIADARLISAAPDMLKALQRITHPMADDDDVAFALDLIRRVTGEAQP